MFRVGGEDTELGGLRAGVISLAKPKLPALPAAPVVTADGAQRADQEKQDPQPTPAPETEPQAPAGAEPADPSSDPVLDNDPAAAEETAAVAAKPAPRKLMLPKPLRPKMRGPISFDAPKLPTIRKGDRPLKRPLGALTPKRPKPASSPASPATGSAPKDEAGDDAA